MGLGASLITLPLWSVTWKVQFPAASACVCIGSRLSHRMLISALLVALPFRAKVVVPVGRFSRACAGELTVRVGSCRTRVA